MKKQSIKKQNGNALITVLMIASLFLIIALAIATGTTHHLMISSSKGEAEKALTLARAGVEQVIYTIEDYNEENPVDLLNPSQYSNSKTTRKTNKNSSIPIPAPLEDLSKMLEEVFDDSSNPNNDLPGYHGEGTVEITFMQNNNKPYSTNNFYSSTPSIGWGGRVVPPYSIHVISVGRIGSTEKKLEAIISKRWPYALFARHDFALWNSSIKGNIFSGYITLGGNDRQGQQVGRAIFNEPYRDLNAVEIKGGDIFSNKIKEVKKLLTSREKQYKIPWDISDIRKHIVNDSNLQSSGYNRYNRKLKEGKVGKITFPTIKDLPNATILDKDTHDNDLPQGIERVEYIDIICKGEDCQSKGTNKYYYIINGEVKIDKNYKIDGDLLNFRIPNGITEIDLGSIKSNDIECFHRLGRSRECEKFTNIKLRIEEGGGLQVNGVIDLRGGEITLNNGVLFSNQNMRLDGGEKRVDKYDNSKGTTISGQGIIASQGNIYLSSVLVTPYEGETMVLYSKGNFIVSPSFTKSVGQDEEGKPKTIFKYADGNYPSSINGLVLVGNNFLVHPKASLTLEGILVKFLRDSHNYRDYNMPVDSLFANIDLTYNQTYAKPLNNYGDTQVVFWKVLP